MAGISTGSGLWGGTAGLSGNGPNNGGGGGTTFYLTNDAGTIQITDDAATQNITSQ